MTTDVISSTQELFDTVAGHLLRQAKRSKNSRLCLYRGPNGLKCAVGCLLTDAVYSVFLEGTNARDIAEQLNISVGRDLADDELTLLTALQEIHDGIEIYRWPVELRAVATRDSLAYPFSVDDEKACHDTSWTNV